MRSVCNLRSVLFAGLLSITPVLAGDAAGQAGAVTGTVVDSSGGAIAGATVILLPNAVGERRLTTDGVGRFTFPDVPAGPATVTVLFDRFAPLTVDVTPGGSDLRVVLQPGALSEQLTVRAARFVTPRIRTATRTDTPLRDVPQAVSIVTRDLIADQTMGGIGDVVRYVPGIGIAQGEGNRDTPIFRGNSSTSDFFVNGVRDDVQYMRDLYNVERVEAIKGPNAMVFGRGGVGGVINRVVRVADWVTNREVSAHVGSFGTRRVQSDIGHAVSRTIALRMTGVFEDSDTYRSGTEIERYGLNPTIALNLGPNTTLKAGYEHFHDDRTADRGIPSVNGAPVETDADTFFGNTALSRARVTLNMLSSTLDHRFGSDLSVRNHLSYGAYDKFYQNVFPGSVNAVAQTVSISGYNNATDRRNVFNQTDVTAHRRTGRISHTILIGAEFGRQVTDNFRSTGYFDTLSPTATSIDLPLASPTTSVPLSFRQSVTDADNHGIATAAAVYAQDQVTLTEHLQAVVGLRYDRFSIDFTNNRSGQELGNTDNLVSPRVGLIVKPNPQTSIYGSYTLTYLPRAGEQLNSLNATTQALDPETYRNYEVGAKWDVRPGLELNVAVYRLKRGNVVVPDPLNPIVSVLVDGQQSSGLELGLTGSVTDAWSVVTAYAYQDGEITQSQSATAQSGARLAQLPEHSLSIWNKYDFSDRWSGGLGLIHRGAIFTSTDNTVTLPGFTRVDAAVFYAFARQIRLQLNVENLFNTDYYAFAHNNNNITPGSPVAVRVGLTTQF
ncbi:MAG: TonB-dependent siderophore receptor [Vicinamibacterales bacterium]